MLTNLFTILCIAFIATAFWHQRKQSELAKQAITHRCEQVNVQLITIARNQSRLKRYNGRFKFITRYDFEFSVNGINCYQGYALMKGMHLQEIHMPAYPI